jgi:hypothetical protein
MELPRWYLPEWKVLPKLSDMESTPPSEQFRAVERGEAAPYVRFPPMPWWYSPVVGAAVAFVTVTAGLAVYERRYAVAAARVRERLR